MCERAYTHIVASVRVCADGGANVCHKLFAEHRIQSLPHCICGDMDSITDTVRNDFNAQVGPK
jgi:thiamine pyrophosphokinase